MKVKIAKYNAKKPHRKVKIKFHNEDFWSLDITLAKIIAPALKKFGRDPIGTPGCLTPKKWKKILDTMQRAFDLIVESDGRVLTLAEDAEVAKGLKLFGKWYRALWT